MVVGGVGVRPVQFRLWRTGLDLDSRVRVWLGGQKSIAQMVA